MQQSALFTPSRTYSLVPGDLHEPVMARFDATELDLGYEVAFPFLSDPPDLED